MFLRWRALALRGRTYFEQRSFADAQRDFHSALAIMPGAIADEDATCCEAIGNHGMALIHDAAVRTSFA